MPSWKQILKNYDKRLNHQEIEDFREHLTSSLNRRMRLLEEEAQSLSPDQFEDPLDIDGYRNHLEDLAASVNAVKSLGDELSIIALYKKVEGHTSRVVKKLIPTAASHNLSYFEKFCKTLPFEIKTVDGYAGFNELRLINNSIKHGGKISFELADEFPIWLQGAELNDLDKTYQRLLPEVKKYVADLSNKLYEPTIETSTD